MGRQRWSTVRFYSIGTAEHPLTVFNKGSPQTEYDSAEEGSQASSDLDYPALLSDAGREEQELKDHNLLREIVILSNEIEDDVMVSHRFLATSLSELTPVLSRNNIFAE